MRMKTRLFQVVIALLVACVAAIVAGCHWAGETGQNTKKFTDQEKQILAQSAAKGDYAFRQYLTADYDQAKEALLSYIRALDRWSAESSRGPVGRNLYAVDAMTSYVRLAKLEQKFNRKEGAQYMKEAALRCERLGWRPCSEEHLRQIVDPIDAAWR